MQTSNTSSKSEFSTKSEPTLPAPAPAAPGDVRARHSLSAGEPSSVCTQKKVASSQRHTHAGFLRRVGILLTIFVVFVCSSVVFSLVFGLYGSASSVAWQDFRSADHVDTAIIGSSYAQRGFNPCVIDEEFDQLSCGTGNSDSHPSSTINIATPGQCMYASYSTLKYAIQQKHVKRVIFGVGPETLSEAYNLRSDIPYLYARYEDDPLQLLKELIQEALLPEHIGMKDSLNILFPWVFIPARSPQLVAHNIQARLSNKPKYLAAQETIPFWHYVGKGYGSYNVVLKENDSATSMSSYGAPFINPKSLRIFREMLEYARAHNVEFICVATPHPAYDIASIGDGYTEVMDVIKDSAQAAGAYVIDANRIRPDKLCIPREGFHDFEHLNLDGAKIFSKYVAQLIYRMEAGEDVSSEYLSDEEWSRRLAHDRF